MNHLERFRALVAGKPVDRLPRWEWAGWWDATIERWRGEGLPAGLADGWAIQDYLGLDPHRQFWFWTGRPSAAQGLPHGQGPVASLDDYRACRHELYPDPADDQAAMSPWLDRQRQGEAVVWATLDGYFWYARALLGIQRHLEAFHEQPELLHAINADLAEFHLRVVRGWKPGSAPAFMTFAEDMSYNHGPMISEAMFAEFMLPYYAKVIPALRERGVVPVMDSDGDVTRMVPWLESAGIAGVLPLERNAGVDGMRIRAAHPGFLMIGHFDKMTMPKGEPAMRAEFERLVPLMRSGRFIPSVDHQTPPGVSLEQYRAYLRLLEEYTGRH